MNYENLPCERFEDGFGCPFLKHATFENCFECAIGMVDDLLAFLEELRNKDIHKS